MSTNGELVEMGLRVVGAGVGRTGTLSLKLALERLLGAPCYHMLEVFTHPEHVDLWHQAALGTMPDWDALFDGYAACVDWPSAAFWPEIAAAYPDARILHSTRSDRETWWQSADETILRHTRTVAETDPWGAMWRAVRAARFSDEIDSPEAWMAAYDAHNAHVLATAPADRLVSWQPGDGWEPICAALGVDIPDEPFPHVNTRAEWASRA